ncbi:hypothetical protein GCM10022407_05350 [Hymenobacter antarcticus]|uniref:Uncharacterized protein n=1 Tax=Hymenobacter antarcticus TaxID=486270 RepID=A0ABP7P928_9BACT
MGTAAAGRALAGAAPAKKATTVAWQNSKPEFLNIENELGWSKGTKKACEVASNLASRRPVRA